VEVTILGAGRCVTGSKYLLRWKRYAALIDCGLFQGPAEHRRRNWRPLPYPAPRIDAVVLTHVHGEYTVQREFAARLEEELGWQTVIPELGEELHF
jgi:metallo-beta-lactamase family protein